MNCKFGRPSANYVLCMLKNDGDPNFNHCDGPECMFLWMTTQFAGLQKDMALINQKIDHVHQELSKS